MEGRAIARPNHANGSPVRQTVGLAACFNGGPGNCPAEHYRRLLADLGTRPVRDASMEGRAIARPNMEAGSADGTSSVGSASMEGRAIARPN